MGEDLWLLNFQPPFSSRKSQQFHRNSITPPKSNIAPEKWWLEDEFPFGIAYFLGRTVKFQGCKPWNQDPVIHKTCGCRPPDPLTAESQLPTVGHAFERAESKGSEKRASSSGTKWFSRDFVGVFFLEKKMDDCQQCQMSERKTEAGNDFWSRWWQLKYFVFSSLPGEDFHFD